MGKARWKLEMSQVEVKETSWKVRKRQAKNLATKF